jgi:hypothetical protein
MIALFKRRFCTNASHQTLQQLRASYQFQRPCATAFHVVMNDGREVWVKIDTLEIIYGKIAQREIAEALAWAATQHYFLLAKFEELQE